MRVDHSFNICACCKIVAIDFLVSSVSASVSGGGGVCPRLCVCRRRLPGLQSVPVCEGPLWAAQLRSVLRQGPAAHRTVLPQPRCVSARGCAANALIHTLWSSRGGVSRYQHFGC